MSIALSVIRSAQRILGDGVAARVLAASGIAQLLRWPHDRRVLRLGVYDASVLGVPAKFVVASRTHLAHIDALWREEAMLRRIVGALREGDRLYDVGANIGLISIASALNVRGVNVDAFEPERRNAEAMRKNLEANGLRNVRVHELALGDRNGQVAFFLDPREGAGAHSLIPRDDLQSHVVVEQVKADDLAERFGPPNVVKIDVEGAEFAVLRGMEQLLVDQVVRDLFLELHPANLLAAGENVQHLREWLEEHGYEVAWRQQRGDEWHEHYRARRSVTRDALESR